jgi:chromosome segregation ATPase
MGFHVSSSDHADFQYALIESGSNTSCSVSDNDAWQTIGKLQKEVESTGHEVMWFELDGKEYALRDRATVERAHTIVQPMMELGSQQGKLGSEQGELGRRQGELGRIQGRIGELQGRFARLQATSSSESRTELEDLRQQLDELRADARDLSERQRELGARQHELGARQRELGERQRIASKEAMVQLKSLGADAIQSGKAELLLD